MTPLRQRMINDMTVRGFAENTKRSYLTSVTGLDRPPARVHRLAANPRHTGASRHARITPWPAPESRGTPMGRTMAATSAGPTPARTPTTAAGPSSRAES